MSKVVVKKRKSPYRHKVRSHIRQGKRIKSYMRGDGEPPQKPQQKRQVGAPVHVPSTTQSGTAYRTTIIYPNLSSETFHVGGASYGEALSTCLTQRTKPVTPKKVRLRMVEVMP